MKILTETWVKEKLLLVPKTRQMRISWLFVSLYLWDAQFHKGKMIFFQSKKAEDANELIIRAKTVWDNEPKFLKRYYEN